MQIKLENLTTYKNPEDHINYKGYIKIFKRHKSYKYYKIFIDHSSYASFKS